MEYHAREARKATGVQVDVYGLATGEGLPGPIEDRVLPDAGKTGFFKMDMPALEAPSSATRFLCTPSSPASARLSTSSTAPTRTARLLLPAS